MTESTEAPLQPASDIDSIIAGLHVPWQILPESAIQAARLHKEAIIPRLIALIEDATRAVQAGEEVETNEHFFALYLLAEFRAREALPAVLKAISLPDEGPFDLFADAITEDVPRVLAALSGGNPEHVTALIDNKAFNDYVRRAAARSLVVMFAADILPRNEAVELLRRSLRRAIDAEDAEVIYGLVAALEELYPEEAMAEIREAYGKRLVDEFMIDLPFIERALRKDRTEHLKRLYDRPALIEDTVEELRDWAAFSKDEEDEDGEDNEEYMAPFTHSRSQPAPAGAFTDAPLERPFRHADERVGRNEPCPCGSGKKFKKCCGTGK